MSSIHARLVGVELYFDDLVAAKNFYQGTLGLDIFGEQPGHHAQFNVGQAFLYLEKRA
jgi:catechol-2,3-dioxygenase